MRSGRCLQVYSITTRVDSAGSRGYDARILRMLLERLILGVSDEYRG
jgi:hypothetical protein